MDLIQDVPPTYSDERMHVLDETCWCNPVVDVVNVVQMGSGEFVKTAGYLRHNAEGV